MYGALMGANASRPLQNIPTLVNRVCQGRIIWGISLGADHTLYIVIGFGLLSEKTD